MKVSLQSKIRQSSLPATRHMSEYHTQVQVEAREAKPEVLYVMWSRAQSLAGVKQEVQQRVGRNPDLMFFLLNGQLTEDWTSGMRAFKSIKVGESVTTNTLTLHITYKDKCHLVAVDPSNTVQTLKVKLQEVTGVLAAEQVLIRCNRVLSDAQMLTRYALMSGHILNLRCKSEMNFCTVVVKPVRGEDPLYTLKVEIDHNTTADSLSKQVCKDLGGLPFTGKVFVRGREDALPSTALLSPTELELLYCTEYTLRHFQVEGVLAEHERLVQSPLSLLKQEVSKQHHPALLAQSDGHILLSNSRSLCFVPSLLHLKVPTSPRYCLVKRWEPGLALLVDNCDSLLQLQTQLEQASFPLSEQILLYHENLVDEEVFNSIEFGENCCLQLVLLRDLITLFIYKGANLWLYLELPYGSLIKELKFLIQQLEGIPVAEQILLFKKTELNDSRTLPQSGLLPGSTLILLQVLHGIQGPLRIIMSVRVRVMYLEEVKLEQVLHTKRKVGDLLVDLEKDMKVARDRLTLFYKDAKLEPDILFEDIAQNDIVELVLKEYRTITFALLNEENVSLQEAITTCMPVSYIISQLSASLDSSVSLYRLRVSPPPRSESLDLYPESNYELVNESGQVANCLYHGDRVFVVREFKFSWENGNSEAKDFTSVESLIQRMWTKTESLSKEVYKSYEITLKSNEEVLTEENRFKLRGTTILVSFRERRIKAQEPCSSDKLLAAALHAKFKSVHFFGESDLSGRLGNRIVMETTFCRKLLSVLLLRKAGKSRERNREITVRLEDHSREYGTIKLKPQNSLQEIKGKIEIKIKAAGYGILDKEQIILISGGYLLSDNMADLSRYVKPQGKITIIRVEENSFLVVPCKMFVDESPTVAGRSCQRFQLAHFGGSSLQCRYSYHLLPTDTYLDAFLASFPTFLLFQREEDLVVSRGSLQAILKEQKTANCKIIEIQNGPCKVIEDLQGNEIVVTEKRHAVPSALLVLETLSDFSLQAQISSAPYQLSMSPLHSLPDIIRKCELRRVISRPFQSVLLNEKARKTEIFNSEWRKEEVNRRRPVYCTGVKNDSKLQVLQRSISTTRSEPKLRLPTT